MVQYNHEQRCDQLREFILVNGRFPRGDTTSSTEKSIYNWLIDQRRSSLCDNITATRQATRQENRDRLASIHPGLLSNKLDFDSNDTPYEWSQQYNLFNSGHNNIEIAKTYKSPYHDKVFVPSKHMTCQQHLMERFNIKHIFKPSDCNTSSPPGTMQNVISYALHPDHYGLSNLPKHNHISIYAPKNPTAPYPSSYFKQDTYTTSHKNKIDQVKDELLSNDLLGTIRDCRDADEVVSLLNNNNRNLFDAFHFPKGGPGGVPIPIFDTRYPQPRRYASSCTVGPTYYSPTHESHYRHLYSYGRASCYKIDIRNRPMPVCLYELGVETWKHVYPTLSPLSQVCPPNICHILLYIDAYNSPERWKGEMRLHKDNPPSTTPPSSEESHIAGTDVITVSIGDEMNFHLIGHAKMDATYDKIRANKGTNWTTTTTLEDGSTYVHSASNDIRAGHTLDFPNIGANSHRCCANKPDTTRVRAALIYRWAGAHKPFRANDTDPINKRYHNISRQAWLQAHNNKTPVNGTNMTFGDKWLQCLGYLDNEGNNIMASKLNL